MPAAKPNQPHTRRKPSQGDLSRLQLERRRMAAAADFNAGMRQAKIVRKYGVSRATASRWARDLKLQGIEGLKKRKPTGRRPRMNRDPVLQLAREKKWTGREFRDAIAERFGVTYDVDHCLRLLKLAHGRRSQEKTSGGGV
jgi:transposase